MSAPPISRSKRRRATLDGSTDAKEEGKRYCVMTHVDWTTDFQACDHLVRSTWTWMGTLCSELTCVSQFTFHRSVIIVQSSKRCIRAPFWLPLVPWQAPALIHLLPFQGTVPLQLLSEKHQ
jgi:hypothetical protein